MVVLKNLCTFAEALTNCYAKVIKINDDEAHCKEKLYTDPLCAGTGSTLFS
jgi:hypothetical protein